MADTKIVVRSSKRSEQMRSILVYRLVMSRSQCKPQIKGSILEIVYLLLETKIDGERSSTVGDLSQELKTNRLLDSVFCGDLQLASQPVPTVPLWAPP